MKFSVLGLSDIFLFPIYVEKQILLAVHQGPDELNLFRKT